MGNHKFRIVDLNCNEPRGLRIINLQNQKKTSKRIKISVERLQYLKYLDQNNIQFKTASNELIQNFELFMLFEKLENQIRSGENHFNGGDKIFQIITANKALETHFYKKGTSDLQGELHNYFEDLFEKYFKKTKAYVSLQQFYISNTILQKNLYLLNIGINQFQLTNLMSENRIIQ